MSILAKWLLAALLALILLKTLVWWLQPRLTFYPSRGPTPPRPPFTEFRVTSEDGVALTGWAMPVDDTNPVIIYFCGNAGNLSDRADLLSGFAGKGVTLVAFNYRGMGESSGSPTEVGVYRDATAIYRHVTETLHVNPDRVILWGHSIGGAVAAWLATEKPCAGLVLESTFRSAKVMAKRMLPVLPITPFITYRLDNEGHMAKLAVPVLLIHGASDDIVPPEDSRYLFDLIRSPRDLWLIQQGGHNDLYQIAGSAFYDRIVGFARQVSTHLGS
jgi:hypothetical protein